MSARLPAAVLLSLVFVGAPHAARAQVAWAPSPTDLPSYRAGLDTIVPRLLREYDTPAAVVVLVEHGQVVLMRQYGSATSRANDTVTASTVFGVASLSKLVTAWGVMHLVDASRMDLDRPFGNYLSPRHRAMLHFDPDSITLRQLLSHTAGLAFRNSKEYWPPDTIGSLEEELQGKSATGSPLLRLTAKPGTAWSYSGGGYGLLQLAVEDVTRMSFASYMRQSVPGPFGMKSSFFGNPELGAGAVAYHTDETGSGVQRAGYANLAAAALYTTAADFSRLVTVHMSRGKGVPGVLRPADFDIMEAPSPGSGGGYGLGYFIETTPRSGPLVGHDGSDVGWNSMYRALPQSGDGFLMFTSSSNGAPIYYAALCAGSPGRPA